MMKHFYFLLITVALLMTSCSNDNDPYIPEITPTSLIGTTFTDGVFYITIESSTKISYYVPTYPELKGEAEYTFQHGIFKVINPYGRRLAAEEVVEPYILDCEGTFNIRNRLDCGYMVVGPYEKVQMSGGGEMWKLEKEK